MPRPFKKVEPLHRKPFFQLLLVLSQSLPIFSVVGCTHDETSTRPEDFYHLIHPRLRYAEEPLPDEENAFTLWKIIDPERFKSDIELPWEDEPFPEGETGLEISRELKKLSGAFDTLNAGIRRKGLQRPKPVLPQPAWWERKRPLAGVTTLLEWKTVHGRKLLSEGNIKGAIEEAKSLLDFHALVRRADLDYNRLFLLWNREQFTLEYVRWLAGRRSLSPEDIERLQLPASYRLPRMDLAMARQVCFGELPDILRLPQQGPLEELLDVWLPRDWPWGHLFKNNPDELEKRRTEFKQERRRQIRNLLRILEDHPRPFDREATVKLISLASMHSLRIFEQGADKEQNRVDAVRRNLEALPDFGDAPFGRLSALSKRELSRKEIRSAKSALRKIENPLGLLRVEIAFSEWQDKANRLFPNIRRTDWDATRTIIALRIHERRHGTLPQSLQILVDSGLLNKLPRDYGTDRMLEYRPTKRVLEDFGKGNSQNRWELPPLSP